MIKMKRVITLLIMIITFVLGANQSKAGYISGESNLLTTGDVMLLEFWLGEGPLLLTNIFTKTDANGKTAVDFHASVDAQGRTFSIIEVLATHGNSHQIIGGYNPQSWSSSGMFNMTPNDQDRTAFLFNLTTTNIMRQELGSGTNGELQTMNHALNGPSFGGGHDIYVDQSLSSGFVSQVSYGTGDGGTNIIGNAANGGVSTVDYRTIEIFTIAEAPPALAPEPVSSTLFVIGGATLGFRLYRRKRTEA